MAGGIEWFRWHHGSVTDPKFQLVARKAGASLPDVLAVWAYLLEKASAAEFRGCFGEIDCEAIDCLFGFADGHTDAILTQLVDRKLIADEYIVAWEKRQPKRERTDDNSTERVRAFRQKQRSETPGNATERTETPREEKSREEEKENKARALVSREDGDELPTHPAVSPTAAGAICRAMKQAGLSAVNPGDPRLLALLEQGATESEFVGLATEAVEKSKGFAWVLVVLEARRREAADISLAPPPTDPGAWRHDDRSLRAMAAQLGVSSRPDERIDGWQRRIVTAWQRAGQPALQRQEQTA